MRRLILHRLTTMVMTLVGLMIITFIVSNVVPGDPARLAAGPEATQQMVEVIRAEKGLDKPYMTRFFIYLGQVLSGDLGTSIHTGRAVVDDLSVFFPATLELVFFSIGFAIVFGIPLGVISAVKQNKAADHLIRIFAVSGVAMPMFWLGLILQWYLALEADILPLGGRLGIMTDAPTHITGLFLVDALLTLNFPVFGEALRHILLPALALGFPSLASIIRVNRAEMLEALSKDYVTNARAQGIGPLRIVAHYALKNALLPTLAMIGLRFGWMLGGTVLVEGVFDWPGIGLYAAKAAVSSDFEPIMAVTLILGGSFMVANLLIDLTYAALDPRVRAQV